VRRPLLAALEDAGHRVETPVTGSVWVDGREITPDEWEILERQWAEPDAFDDLSDLGFDAPAREAVPGGEVQA
jgi:hypothetical protein